eukprot:3724202-Lingulodinium_polyedra.AAC.1
MGWILSSATSLGTIGGRRLKEGQETQLHQHRTIHAKHGAPLGTATILGAHAEPDEGGQSRARDDGRGE